MPFDEEEIDPHGECAAEIARLNSRWTVTYDDKGDCLYLSALNADTRRRLSG